MRTRGYVLTSRWRIPATPEECWAATERMLRPGGRSWWPGVRVPAAPARLAAGEELALVVRSPIGYRLRIRVTLTEALPARRLAARSTGDLAGTGSVDLVAVDAARTILRIRWEVATRRAWMNATAFLLRPAFVLAHAVVMRAGERGMRRAVRAASETRNADSCAPGAGSGKTRG